MNTVIASMQCPNWRPDGEFVHCTQCRESVKMVIKSSDYYHLYANWSFVRKYVVTYTCKGSLLMGVVCGDPLVPVSL